MQPIDRPGTFRGTVVDHAVSATKNGFPQFVGHFQALEYFDEETGEWVDWAEYQAAITGYLVLFASGGPCLNAAQCQIAFGWDGKTYESLDAMKLSEKVVLFRVEEQEYKGTWTKQVTWVDDKDAPPTRSLKKLNPAALKDLDSKFKLGGGAKLATPASAPGKPATPKPAKPSTPAPAKPAESPEPQADPEPTATPPAAPATPKRSPAKPKGKDKDTPKVEPCTKEEAWAKLCEFKLDECTDDMLSEAWLASIDAVAPDIADDDKITPAQWGEVYEKTIAKIPHAPF